MDDSIEEQVADHIEINTNQVELTTVNDHETLTLKQLQNKLGELEKIVHSQQPRTETRKIRTKTQEELKQAKKAKRKETIFTLLPQSTNAWLYIRDQYHPTEDNEDEENKEKRNCCTRFSDNVA
eukprot:222697_1